MGLVDMIVVPIELMPLDTWEQQLFEGYATIQLFSLDLSMLSKVFTHDAQRYLIYEGERVFADSIRAFGKSWQLECFENADATANVLESYFLLIYDEEYRLKEIKRNFTD